MSEQEIIDELKGAIVEAVSVFDRPTHQIDSNFPEYSAMRRMKDAIKMVDMKNIKIKNEGERLKKLTRQNKDLKNSLKELGASYKP